jgi:hypothetical protein
VPSLPLIPTSCPRFQTCSAAVCPLDLVPSYHRGDDRVCYYLVSSSKAGAAERFADDPVFQACLERLPDVVARHPRIGTTVAKAARTKARGDHFRRSNRENAGRTLDQGAEVGVGVV